MKLAFLGDIHSNIISLRKAIKLCISEGVDKIVSLGDTIGYGNEPNEVCRLLIDCKICLLYTSPSPRD